MTSSALTITEALAEIRTIEKREAKKREAITAYLAREDQVRDPLESVGGAASYITQERQALHDLGLRRVELRSRIAATNAATSVTVAGQTRTIADWLTWRREVAPGQQQFLAHLRRSIDAVRKQAQQKGVALVSATATSGSTTTSSPHDIIVNVSESELHSEIEELEEVLGTLDGRLSLINATTTV